MSETDSFIEEVTEEVRRDRLFKLFKKYAWVGALVVLALVGGTAYNEYSKAQKTKAAMAAGDTISAALAAKDAEALAQLANSDAPAAVIAGFAEATVLSDAGDTEAAVAALQAIADRSGVAPVYTHLALLKIILLDGAALDPARRSAIFDIITGQDAPYRLLAIEQRAIQHLRDGETEDALADFARITADETATQGLRNRARQLTIALGGNDQETSG